jgi:hypothetical protein
MNASAQQTETLMLSGTGSDNTVNWEFFCTEGRNSGKWTTIPVPSNWEQFGFGGYNYGHDKDSVRHREKGLYRYRFNIPAAWKSKTVQIVFEGSMTDTEVKINGKSAGEKHQGSFYCFKYDITNLLQPGKKNLLEVTVAKHSANDSVNRAERKGDFWVFGGIFRPVYLQAFPRQHIGHVAIDARANGNFRAKVQYVAANSGRLVARLFTIGGEKAGEVFSSEIKKGDTSTILQYNLASPLQWTPESPNRYKVEISLQENGNTIHTVTEKFGFRTIELRPRDGVYLNDVKIKFKGICRHSFNARTARALNEKISIADVLAMKDMNMNAVRMSHYPPDDHFLDACDSLGLMVLDELAGWHWHYDTPTGTKLVKEMVAFDANHPSIIFWNNGNEGGHNTNLDPVFAASDFQKRPVVHPWQVFNGMDNQHYINYNYGNGTHLYGHEVVFPTEFLHGLYDGGLGAGLEDYWELMWHHPLSAGGFLWVFRDEGIMRTDKNGLIDTDGNHAADGVLGPNDEKEGSYDAIKEIWSPVHFEQKEITEQFDGKFNIENRYFFTNLDQCRFKALLVKFDVPGSPNAGGNSNEIEITAPHIAPGQKGRLQVPLPRDWRQFDVMYIVALDPYEKEIFTWGWPLTTPAKKAASIVGNFHSGEVTVQERDSLFVVGANGISVSFHKKTGILIKAANAKGIIPFNNGPILSEGDSAFHNMSYRREGNNVVVESGLVRKSNFQSLQWTIYPSGWVKMQAKYFPKEYETTLIGMNFNFPENTVKSIQWMGNGPYRVWKNRLKGAQPGVYNKAYNNTSTGEGELIYPEFKGYFADFYWMKLITTGQPLTVICASDDIFLRLFTPKFSATPFNTAPPFPAGDISFMHGISPIGTKSQRPERMGPMSQKNMYYDNGKDPLLAKDLTLYFDFSGN